MAVDNNIEIAYRVEGDKIGVVEWRRWPGLDVYEVLRLANKHKFSFEWI